MFGNMLVIHSVNPTGMFSYGLSRNINLLNRGLVHLVGVNEDKGGDSNGSGKSSLFNAICELLFQENPTGEKGDSVINSIWNKGFAGRVMITNWQGIHYRITYCRKWKEQLYPADNDNGIEYVGTGLFLDKFEDKVWKDVRGAGMPETHQKILEVVGLTYRQFISIAYMTHRIGSQFLRGTNKERIDILSGITGIEEWDRILEKCRTEKKYLNSQIADLNQKISFEEGSVQTLKEQLNSYKNYDWESYLQGLNDWYKTYQADLQLIEDETNRINLEINKLAEIRDQSYNSQKLVEINAQLTELQRQLRGYENDLAKSFYAEEDPKLRNSYQEIVNALGLAQGELRAVKGSAGSILELVECPTCGSKITKAKKERISKKIKELESQITSLTISKQSAEQVNKEFYKKQIEDDQKYRDSLKAQINKTRKDIEDKIEEREKERAVYLQHEQKIQSLKSTLLTLQSDKNQKIHQMTDAQNKIDQAGESMKYIKVLEGQVKDKKKQIKILNADASRVESVLQVQLWLISNIPYIKLHKMSRAMSEISEMCNRYFDEMGDTIRINISSFEEKVSKRHPSDIKDLMKSEVKVEIIDGNKNISPKLYSDGEISKVSLAVIRALHELARKSGQGCNLMLMDEVFSFVDGDNSQRIAQSLSGFLNKGTVFLTDNSGSVKNLINFDQVWVARKKNGRTLLEMDQ